LNLEGFRWSIKFRTDITRKTTRLYIAPDEVCKK
jgi:hypothetical protein